jgi:hypothetical protein
MIKFGMSSIRAAGWSKVSERRASEADHDHNPPDLVSNFPFEMFDHILEDPGG